MIEAASRAARIQAKHIFYNSHLPEKTGHLWGESFNWACHALNMTATTTALQHDWTLNHWDIKQAFVQSRIDREIFVRLPEGCRHVC